MKLQGAEISDNWWQVMLETLMPMMLNKPFRVHSETRKVIPQLSRR
jgi:hypothetical protein